MTDTLSRQSADLLFQVRVYEDLIRNLHPHLDHQLALQVEKVIGGVRQYRAYFVSGQSSNDT